VPTRWFVLTAFGRCLLLFAVSAHKAVQQSATGLRIQACCVYWRGVSGGALHFRADWRCCEFSNTSPWQSSLPRAKTLLFGCSFTDSGTWPDTLQTKPERT